jgi:hypothetical protein
MKKILIKTALFAYINAICFRDFKPSCVKISENYNRNIVGDSKGSYISHDKLQRLLQIEQLWNLFLIKQYRHLTKNTCSLKYKKASKKKTFLIIDDTVIAKPFSKGLEMISWLWSSSDRRYLYGLNVVFVIWTDGNTRFPIGFRIWNKKEKKTRTRLDLAMEILKDAKKIYKLNPDYVLMDSFYAAAKLLKRIKKLKWHWIAKLRPNRSINKIQVKDYFKYRYGNEIGKLAQGIKAVVVKDKNCFWASSDTKLDSPSLKKLYRKRQIIEEFFKILKSELRLEGCPSRSIIAQSNHIYFILFAFCRLEDFRIRKNITTIYKVRLVLINCIIPKTLNWKLDVNRIA